MSSTMCMRSIKYIETTMNYMQTWIPNFPRALSTAAADVYKRQESGKSVRNRVNKE